MNCQECRDVVSAGLDGEASAEEQAAAEEHLAGCPPCRRAAERATLITRLARTDLVRPTPDYVDRVLAAYQADEQPSGAVLSLSADCGCPATCRCGCQDGDTCQCGGKVA